MADIKQAVKLIKQALSLLTGGGEEDKEQQTLPVKFPLPKEVAKMNEKKLAEVAGQFGIDAENVSDLEQVLTLAAQIVAGQDVEEDLDMDVFKELCEACTVTFSKKAVAKNIEEVKTFLEVATDETDGDDSGDGDGDDDEKPAKKGKKPSDDDDDDDAGNSDSDDDEDEDEKPAKKGKKAPKDDDEDDNDGSDDDEDEKPAKKGKKPSADDDEDEDEAPEITEKHLKLYNKHAKNALKTVKELAARLVDSNGDTTAWGEWYPKNGQAWCCGFPLIDVDAKKHIGKCRVTGQHFQQDEETGKLEKIEAPEED